MKKLILLLLVFAGVRTAQAEKYNYLTIETTEGAKVSVPVASLALNFSGTTLVAGSQQFTLANLSKMYFTVTDETATTGIESLLGQEATSAVLDEATEIYDLRGHRLTQEQMRKGAYIVKTKERTYKIIVK